MKPHPITVEVVRNAVVAYADEMANVLAKSAYNMMIYEVRDYCCGLLDAKGRMIAQNRGGLPIFLADLGPAVEDGIARYGLGGFQPGDVVIMNHGGVCGQHLNNVVIYAPCFHEGEIVGFAASRLVSWRPLGHDLFWWTLVLLAVLVHLTVVQRVRRARRFIQARAS